MWFVCTLVFQKHGRAELGKVQHGPILAPPLYWNTACPVTYILSVASWQSSIVTTETTWYLKPKLFTIRPYTKMFANLSSRKVCWPFGHNWGNTYQKHLGSFWKLQALGPYHKSERRAGRQYIKTLWSIVSFGNDRCRCSWCQNLRNQDMDVGVHHV